MANIPFPLSSTPGSRAGEGQGRLLNCYAEKEGDVVYWRRVAGLAASLNTGGSTPRGLYKDKSNTVWSAYSGALCANASTVAGALAGTDGVTFAENANNIAVCRSSGGAYYYNGAALVNWTTLDADLPTDVNSVTDGNGYFFFSQPSGVIWASGLNATSFDPLSYATAESKRDALRRVVWTAGRLYAMGASTIEIWQDVGTSPFPLAPHTSVIPVGLLTTMAAAGFEEGWDRAPHFVAHDGTVRKLDGYRATRVSTPDVERFIKTSTTSTLVAFVYTVRGNAMWVLTSDAGTWEFNVTTGFWNERDSATTTGWRAKHSVKGSNGLWYVGDTTSTHLLSIDEGTY